jgi:hypothetical protein
MTNLADSPCARLFTTWGTALYVDPASGELRHGAIESSPHNAFLVGDPRSAAAPHLAWLVYDNAELRQPIVCSPNGFQTRRRCFHSSGGTRDGPTQARHDRATVGRSIPLRRW